MSCTLTRECHPNGLNFHMLPRLSSVSMCWIFFVVAVVFALKKVLVEPQAAEQRHGGLLRRGVASKVNRHSAKCASLP